MGFILPTGGKHCKKPCYDCPFRSDHGSYQTEYHLQVNLRGTLDLKIPPTCHHSVMDVSKSCTWLEKPNPVICAGSLLFMQNCGVASNLYPNLHIESSIPVFHTADEMTQAVRSVQSNSERYRNWFEVQPVHTQENLRRENERTGAYQTAGESLA